MVGEAGGRGRGGRIGLSYALVSAGCGLGGGGSAVSHRLVAAISAVAQPIVEGGGGEASGGSHGRGVALAPREGRVGGEHAAVAMEGRPFLPPRVSPPKCRRPSLGPPLRRRWLPVGWLRCGGREGEGGSMRFGCVRDKSPTLLYARSCQQRVEEKGGEGGEVGISEEGRNINPSPPPLTPPA